MTKPGEVFDSVRAAEAAELAAARQDVARWVRRVRTLVKDMPEGLSVFVSGGSINVMASSDDGDFMTRSGGVDPEAVVASVSTRSRWDGGGW